MRGVLKEHPPDGVETSPDFDDMTRGVGEFGQ